MTLTYSDDNLPYDENGNPCLQKHDVRKFLVRWRKNVAYKFRHFFVGEYGDALMRPHYHGLLFFQSYDSYKLKTYEDIINNWSLGNVYFGTLTPASCHYCTKYCLKDSKVPDTYKPFGKVMTSTRPALGVPFLEDPTNFEYVKNRQALGLPPLVNLNGYQYSYPRFIRDKVHKAEWNKSRSMRYNLEFSAMREQYREDLSKYGYDETTWAYAVQQMTVEREDDRLRKKTLNYF